MIRYLKISFQLFLVCTASALLFICPALASDGETIKSFDSKIILDHQGTASITETIDYDFGANQRHGVYRYIPYRLSDDQGHSYQLTISAVSATQDGLPVNASLSQDSTDQVIKIGDPNRTSNGRHIYAIGYRLMPVIMRQTDGDLLRYNVTGNGWSVPIESATTTVTSSDGLSPTAATCYTGVAGAEAKNCLANPLTAASDRAPAAAARGYQFATSRALAAGEGLTIDLAWPSNSFTNYLVSRPPGTSFGQLFTLTTSFAGLLLILVALAWLIYRRLKTFYAKHTQTIIPHYQPPDGLKPAELGFIIDDKIDLIEITATIIDLAVRGYLKITQTAPRQLAGLKAAKYSLAKVKDGADLESYESTLFKALFSRSSETTLSAISPSTTAKAVRLVKPRVEQHLKAKGYYILPRKQKHFQLIGAAGFIVLLLLLAYTNFVLSGPIILAAGLLAVYLVYRTRRSTALGVAEWAKIEGFKLFLRVTEADRLKFSDAPTKNPDLFSKYLPHAIALRVDKQWAKQFKDIKLTPGSMSWYHSSGSNFSSHHVSSQLSTDFAHSISGTFSSGSGSSAGFGGGFSGGGVGGGGGGSW